MKACVLQTSFGLRLSLSLSLCLPFPLFLLTPALINVCCWATTASPPFLSSPFLSFPLFFLFLEWRTEEGGEEREREGEREAHRERAHARVRLSVRCSFKLSSSFGVVCSFHSLISAIKRRCHRLSPSLLSVCVCVCLYVCPLPFNKTQKRMSATHLTASPPSLPPH